MTIQSFTNLTPSKLRQVQVAAHGMVYLVTFVILTMGPSAIQLAMPINMEISAELVTLIAIHATITVSTPVSHAIQPLTTFSQLVPFAKRNAAMALTMGCTNVMMGTL